MEWSEKVLSEQISAEIAAYLEHGHSAPTPVRERRSEEEQIIIEQAMIPLSVVIGELELTGREFLALHPESELVLQLPRNFPVSLRVGEEKLATGELRRRGEEVVVVIGSFAHCDATLPEKERLIELEGSEGELTASAEILDQLLE